MSKKPCFRTSRDSQHVKLSEKPHLCNSENIPQPIQLQLSKKKFFFQFFAGCLKSTSIFEHSEKNVGPFRLCIIEKRDCEICG